MKKQFVLFILLVALLFGCNQKESISAPTPQDIDANKTYVNSTITDLKVEDGAYIIYFEHNGVRGPITAKAPTTEDLYKGLEEYKATKAKEDKAYDVFDIMIDGDDTFIIGISPSIKRHE